MRHEVVFHCRETFLKNTISLHQLTSFLYGMPSITDKTCCMKVCISVEYMLCSIVTSTTSRTSLFIMRTLTVLETKSNYCENSSNVGLFIVKVTINRRYVSIMCFICVFPRTSTSCSIIVLGCN